MIYVCICNNCMIFCQKCQRVKHIIMGNNANKAVSDPTKVTKPAKDTNEAIGRKGYIIIAQLGEGAFGKVYKVKAKDSNEMFAIKETPFLGEEGYDRTMREVANGCILNHMNIVKLNEYFIDKGTNKLYLTMELCEFNLRQWFARTVQNRSYTEGIRMILQIAAGVDYFHGKNIIHRDLKPENILIINNTCKIADFGLSKINIKPESLVGTPIYASPEQIMFGSCDLKTDIYPMGLMVMEFFTVFNNDHDWLEAMKKIQNRNREFPEKFFERHKDNSPQKYTEAKNLVLSMTKNDPNERPTIKDVIKHPFFDTQTDAPQRESNQVNNVNDSNDIKRLIAALMLLRRLRDDNDETVETDETNETDNGSENQILSKALSQRVSEHERSSNESEEINRILNEVTSRGEEQSHRERINDSNERNRILGDIITQGHARRQQIFDEIEERNRMILDIMAQGDAQVKQLWNEMLEEMKIIMEIIIDGKSRDEISDDIKKKYTDILMILVKGTKRLKKLQKFEGLNRTITETLTEHQMHRSIYDYIDDKMRTLITNISVDTDDSKDKSDSTDEDLEDNILAACESYTDNVQLESSLMALYHCLKTRAKKFQNIKRALDIVLHTMTENPQETKILTVALAALSHIVKSDELTLNPNTDINRKIITKILDAMHAHRDETGIFVNSLKTLISFKIPDDVIFEYSRIVNILLYNLAKGYTDSFIQNLCVYILSSMTYVKDKRNIIGDLGGIQTMIEIINSRLQRKVCDEVMIEAWKVMWSIMDEDPINCERFLNNNGLHCFISCTHTFPKNVELIYSMIHVMANFAECDHLRHRLMESEYIKILIKHLDCSERDNFEVSYAAAGIFSHIVSDGPESWQQYVTFELSDILSRLNTAILQWKINSERSVNYNSFKPFLRLLRSDQSPPEAKHWAIWALANLTRVNCSRYCLMLEDDNAMETLECVISNSETQTHIQQLALMTLFQYHKYKKDGNLGGIEDSDVIELF